MAMQFILSHTSFGKSLSPPSGVGYSGQDKPSALENVETGQKTRNDRGLKIMDRPTQMIAI